MKKVISPILFFMLLISGSVFGQLSPGDLSQAHADLEGMSNCTLCHELGDKVTDQKCLECHKEIQSLLSQNRGYHSHNTVDRKDCFECHSEHHGRKFNAVRFDEDNFDHDLAGYKLEGEHAVIDCRECHASENIHDKDIKDRKDTFLGMEQECLSCHDDYHQETLGNDCISCHNMDGFSPAGNFDHAETDYPLLGEHATVDCLECHEMATRNGKDFQIFDGVEFADCKSCHEDPHDGRIMGTCMQCHTETSFTDFVGKGNFNHSTTNFELLGSHKTIACFTCHAENSNADLVFTDQNNIEENNCLACHDDIHDGKFGNECAKCHNETSFFAMNNMDLFDHGLTDYPLEGQHVQVDCKACHIDRLSTPLDFSACNSCHEDYHQGEFVNNNISPDCIECHSLNEGFDYSLYTLEQHQETIFPLEGAHIATPCFACHISEEDDRWSFRNVGSECIDCHDDLHEGYISEQYYPGNQCTACHVNDAWATVEFDHGRTDWPLDGKHVDVACSACHFERAEDKTVLKQTFNSLDTQCASCHENVHDDEFAINGVTDCQRCHVTSSWFPENFDHNTTRFPLDGQHAVIECRACHEINNDKGETIVVYKIEKFECIDCHQ